MRASEQGFTLLEAVIGTTLLAMIMGALLIGMRVGNRAWERGEARLREVHLREARSELLLKQISSLIPRKARPANPDIPGEIAVLEATATCLRFIAPYGTHFRTRSGLLFVEYALVGSRPAGLSLILRETPVTDERGLVALLIERVDYDRETGKSRLIYRPFSRRESDLELMKGLEMAHFEYFGPAKTGKEPTWASEWLGDVNAPFPEGIRFVWREAGRLDQIVVPIQAHALPS